MKKKFLKKYSIILCAGVVIISAIELSGNVGNHASAEMISQNGQVKGYIKAGTISGWTDQVEFNTKPEITDGVFTGSKTVSGAAAPGATVDLYATSGKVTVTADKMGYWTANLTTGLTAGTIFAWSALNGQNWIESDQVKVNTKPVITAGGLTGSKTVSGTAAPGATVDLYATSGKVTVTADEKGNWTANLTTGLTAGNIFAWSALNGQNWIESDLVTVEVPKPLLVTNITSTTASGTAEPGAVLQIQSDEGRYVLGQFYGFGTRNGVPFYGKPIGNAVADSNGNWSCQFVPDQGYAKYTLDYNHHVQVTDLNGATSKVYTYYHSGSPSPSTDSGYDDTDGMHLVAGLL
jgi:hypothetical protein